MSGPMFEPSLNARLADVTRAGGESAEFIHTVPGLATSTWSIARKAAVIFATLAIVVGGMVAMVWLSFELVSWWRDFSYQPIHAGGPHLQELFR